MRGEEEKKTLLAILNVTVEVLRAWGNSGWIPFNHGIDLCEACGDESKLLVGYRNGFSDSFVGWAFLWLDDVFDDLGERGSVCCGRPLLIKLMQVVRGGRARVDKFHC